MGRAYPGRNAASHLNDIHFAIPSLPFLILLRSELRRDAPQHVWLPKMSPSIHLNQPQGPGTPGLDQSTWPWTQSHAVSLLSKVQLRGSVYSQMCVMSTQPTRAYSRPHWASNTSCRNRQSQIIIQFDIPPAPQDCCPELCLCILMDTVRQRSWKPSLHLLWAHFWGSQSPLHEAGHERFLLELRGRKEAALVSACCWGAGSPAVHEYRIQMQIGYELAPWGVAFPLVIHEDHGSSWLPVGFSCQDAQS